MGRLPATFADREIKDRFPYSIAAELLLTTGQTGIQFPDAVFQNGTDKPFECHRLVPRVYAVDDAAGPGVLLPAQPDQELLAGLVRLDIIINNLEQKLTKAPTLIGTLTKGSAERTWEYADPCYLLRSTGFQVTTDALTFPAIAALNRLKVALDFQGFLLIVSPPFPNR